MAAPFETALWAFSGRGQSVDIIPCPHAEEPATPASRSMLSILVTDAAIAGQIAVLGNNPTNALYYPHVRDPQSTRDRRPGRTQRAAGGFYRPGRPGTVVGAVRYTRHVESRFGRGAGGNPPAVRQWRVGRGNRSRKLVPDRPAAAGDLRLRRRLGVPGGQPDIG